MTPRYVLLDDVAIENQAQTAQLVLGVLGVASLAVLVGRPSVGKSFVAVSLAFAVASGTPWLGRFPARRGLVVYVAAEGRAHLGERVRAWKRQHGAVGPVGVHFLTCPFQFASSEDVGGLLDAIAGLAAPPALIVVDTLARCSVGADENSAKDMGVLIDAVRRIQEATGAAVLLVHHAGRRGDHARGSSALEGAADTVIHLTKSGAGATMTCEKQKDAEPFGALSFKLEPVDLTDGESSCVPVPCDAAGTSRGRELSRNAVAAREALVGFGAAGATHGQWKAAAALAPSSFGRALTELRGRGVHARNGRYFATVDQSQGPSPVPFESHGTEVQQSHPSPPLRGDGGTGPGPTTEPCRREVAPSTRASAGPPEASDGDA